MFEFNKLIKCVSTSFLLTSFAHAELTSVLSWERPTERENGTELTKESINHYNVYFEPNSGGEVQLLGEAAPGTLRMPLNLSVEGCLRLTTVTVRGYESEPSEAVCVDFGEVAKKASIKVEIKWIVEGKGVDRLEVKERVN